MPVKAEEVAALRARNALLERELALHRDALEHMHQGVCMYDSSGTIALCNRRYAEILRLPPELVRPGLTGSDVVRLGMEAGHYPAGRTLDEIRQDIRAQMATDAAAPGTMVRDGHTYEVQRQATPQGHLVTTCEDITAQVTAKAALGASEARLSAMLEAMPDCVKIFDAHAQIIYINPKGLELLEAPDLETLTASGHVPLPPEHLPRAIEVHGRVMAGESVVWEYEVLGMKGRRSHVEAHAVPFRMPDGTPAHMSITRDVSERRAAEDALRLSGERLRLVHEATGLADFESIPGAIIQISDRFIEQTGLPAGTRSLTFQDWLEIVHPDDREQLQQAIAESLEKDGTVQCEFRIVRPDTGEVRWIYSRTKMKRDENGRAVRSIGAHLDITESKRAEEALRESEERFRLAAEAAGLGIWDYDLTLDRREWSDRLREIFGVPADAEPSLALAEECIHPADRAKFIRTLRDARSADVARFEASFRIRRADDGAERWVTMNGWRTYKADRKLRRIIMTLRDVTEEKTAEERIRWTASHDALTRLANRTLFQEKLDQAIRAAGAEGGAVGLVLLDLDHFKQINDTLGHDAGDRLLQMFAERLRGVVRAHDTIARLGGDEFAIVLPNIHSEQNVIQLTRSIEERMREPFVHGGRILDCRASMGGSIFPMHGKDSEALLKNADMALYSAKAGGRATATLYEPYMRDEMQRRLSMVQLARNAIRDDRIIPYYQPKFDIAERNVTGFEALLRWRTPRGGIGSPAALEAAFEDLEVAATISDRMIECVIADMRDWLDRGLSFGSVAINASAAEFRRDNFAERLLEQLGQAGIPTSCVQLEVTETVFLGRGAEYVHRALALLSARGVTIALDDFGTGYASLRHLKQFPVDIIKIDQSFVRDILTDPGDEAIIHAVINLGRNLGIKVVAEGIEKEPQALRLLELGCQFGQGFLFSKPAAAKRVPGILSRSGSAASVPPLQRPNRPLRLVAGAR
jgi:diguanylate cyclase (GGDEF)-like protein/PAS domain S-box-containing protein